LVVVAIVRRLTFSLFRNTRSSPAPAPYRSKSAAAEQYVVVVFVVVSAVVAFAAFAAAVRVEEAVARSPTGTPHL
jgi:hypothetical protein